jgi:hypothetical protein
MCDKNILRIFVLMSLTILSFSCNTNRPGFPGYITESVSQFDNSKQISIEPALMRNKQIWLGLFKSSKMKDASVVMTAEVLGAHNFAQGESLHFNLDGKIISLKSIDPMTDLQYQSGFAYRRTYVQGANWSSQRYLVKEEFINQLVSARQVYVKVDLMKTFVEDDFSDDCSNCARPAFKKFLDLISKY